jgi:hypothetical protein
MKKLSLILFAASLGMSIGCSGDSLPPEESMANDLKAANIKPGGESHSAGATKADGEKMKAR